VLGLAVLGNALSPSWEPRRPPADFGYGSLPPVPEPISSVGPASDAIEGEYVRMRVRDTVLGGTVVSPAEDGRYPTVVFGGTSILSLLVGEPAYARNQLR
jgi:hypothetical protein